MIGQSDDMAVSENKFDRVGHYIPRSLINNVEDILKWNSGRFCLCPTDELLGDWIHEFHAPFLIGRYDSITNTVKCGREPFLAFEELDIRGNL